MTKDRYPIQKAIGSILEDGENNLLFLACGLLNDLWQSIKILNEETLKYDRKLYALTNQMKDPKSMMNIADIGEIPQQRWWQALMMLSTLTPVAHL